MRIFAIILLFLSATALFAQEEQSGMVKTANGALVVWNEPGDYFTLEIKSKDIRPGPQSKMLYVDGLFFQIQTAAKKHFLKDPSDKTLDDRAILAAHRDWERDYTAGLLKHELKVESEFVEKDGVLLLGWSYDMPKVSDKQTSKQQLFLTVVKRDHVLVLNTAIEDLADARDAKALMMKTIMTLKSSDKPLSLQKASEQVKKAITSN